MRHTDEKGTKVNSTEYRGKTPSAPRTGVFATALAFLCDPGSSALSLRTLVARSFVLAAVGAMLCVALLAPGTASAAFTRPFLHQITAIPGGLQGGVAVDTNDNVWVGAGAAGGGKSFSLDQYEYPSDAFLETLEIEGESPPSVGLARPESLAIDSSTHSFYVTGNNSTSDVERNVEVFGAAGAFLARWPGGEGEAHIAIDNSIEPSTGSVYVADSHAIRKFNTSGKPVDFVESGNNTYVSGNTITGAPGVSFGTSATLGLGVAVDSHGNIYASVSEYLHTNESAVVEYRPSGLFAQACTGAETPSLGGSSEGGGFGGLPRGVAVDPVSGDILVAISDGGHGARPAEGAIDEFDSSCHFLNQITETSSGDPLSSAFEMAVDSHGDLYVVDSARSEPAVDIYGPGRLLPDLRLGEATDRKPTSAALHGTVEPETLALTDCHFEYVTEAAFQSTGFSDLSSGGSAPCAPAAASIPHDSNPHSVAAEITGISSGTTYRYRLLATTAGALGGTAETAPLAFTAPHAPLIESTTAANLSSSFADLRAQVNPLGVSTSYQFQYLTAVEYTENGGSFEGAHAPNLAPPAPAAIGSGGATGSASAAVLEHIGGLQPATAYVFRVLATNEVGDIAGPTASFVTLPEVAAGLPDGRAYEMLTPPNKGSAEDMFASPLVNGEFSNADSGIPAESADGFLLATRAGFGPLPASGESAYVFSRHRNGWDYTSLASPFLGVQSIADAIFEPYDFSRVGFVDNAGAPASLGGASPTSLVGPPGGPYTTLRADSPILGVLESKGEGTGIFGASRDLGHLILESRSHSLAPAAFVQDEGSGALYESAGAGECNGLETSNCSLLDFNPKGKVFTCGAVLGQGRDSGARHNAVAADGSRVLFTAPDPYMSPSNGGPGGTGCWNGATVNAPQLYMRTGGQTIQISMPQPGAPEASAHRFAVFVGASEDDSRVFFISEGELTHSDEGIEDPELYEWRSEGAVGIGGEGCAAAEGCVTRVSAGESGHAEGGLFAVPAVSADGSAVYFIANGVLAPGASPGTCKLATGVCSLYRYDTASATTAYVATVNASDYPLDLPAGGWWPPSSTRPNVVALDPGANWSATPDGRHLLFASTRELTSYSTASSAHCLTPHGPGAGDGHCAEVYRYEASTGALICVSCNPTGAPPMSNAEFTRSTPASPATGPMSAISADGSYAFFDTADALVPQDTNGTLDVYEWEAHGTGGCRSEQGCISLISSGHDSAPSFFMGASPDGRSVFFGTHARLVAQDTDNAGDLYDARICTGSDPCLKPPPGGTAQCEGDACQNPPPAPIDATPGSLTFSGAGNVLSEPPLPAPQKTATKKAAKCAKGKKLRHGKCVKSKRKKKVTKTSRAGNRRGAKR